MRIEECYIENFGVLHQVRFTFKAGLNVFAERNGWGKSTLAAFIINMLYGMDYSPARKQLSDREKYRSWSGGTYGGYLVVKKEGIRYRIERTFGQKDKEDTFALYLADTGRPADDFSCDIGNELFGIGRDSFERSVLINSYGKKPLIQSDIEARLNGLIAGNDEENDFNQAYGRLDRLAGTIKKKRGSGGLIDRCDEEKVRLMTELDSCKKAENEAESIKKKIDGIQSVPESASGNNSVPVFIWVLFLIFTLLTCVFAVQIRDRRIIAAMIAADAALVLLLMCFRKKGNDNKKAIEEKLAELGSDYKVRYEELCHAADKRSVIEAELIKNAERKNELQKKYEMLQLTMELLMEAKDSLHERYYDRIDDAFDRYLGELNTDGNIGRIVLDAELNARKEENGGYHEEDFLSHGEREQISFCTRLALVDAMFTGEQPFLILDDPFIEFDDERFEKAAELMRKAGLQRQILYFTCSRSRNIVANGEYL